MKLLLGMDKLTNGDSVCSLRTTISKQHFDIYYPHCIFYKSHCNLVGKKYSCLSWVCGCSRSNRYSDRLRTNQVLTVRTTITRRVEGSNPSSYENIIFLVLPIFFCLIWNLADELSSRQ